jgi:hypothetical protein
MEVVAFWIALAAVIIAVAVTSNISAQRSSQVKHETIRLMLEKGEKVDDKLLLELLKPAPPPKKRDPSGDIYRFMRVIGTLMLFAGPGVTAIVSLNGYMRDQPHTVVTGLAIGFLIVLVGAGLNYASRYLTQPGSRDSTAG